MSINVGKRASDKRYFYLRAIYKNGALKSFGDIFDIVPKSIIANDLGLNYGRLTKKVNKINLLTIGDLRKLSALLLIDLQGLLEILINDLMREK